MYFKPTNRHLLIEKVEEKKEESKSTILVPDDYKVKSSPYGLYTVKDIAGDCEKSFGGNGTKIVVNDSMVEEISVEGEKYYLVLENYVYGMFLK